MCNTFLLYYIIKKNLDKIKKKLFFFVFCRWCSRWLHCNSQPSVPVWYKFHLFRIFKCSKYISFSLCYLFTFYYFWIPISRIFNLYREITFNLNTNYFASFEPAKILFIFKLRWRTNKSSLEKIVFHEKIVKAHYFLSFW